MAVTKVKAASGRLVRHPETMKPLPVVGDQAEPVAVDLDDPHWYRRFRDGDIVEVPTSESHEPAREPTAAPLDGGIANTGRLEVEAMPAPAPETTASPVEGIADTGHLETA